MPAKRRTKQRPAPSAPAKTPPPFRIVGIGASAGGLEALLTLLRALPDTPNAAFIFAQHLSPEHESKLPGLVAKATKLQVLEARDGQRMEPGRLYVVKPATSIRVDGRRLQVSPLPKARADQRLIDELFSSLCEDDGHAIGVLLSGTGTDGAHGLGLLKAAGGIAIAQEPSTAKFDGMPRAAIARGHVDFVLAPEEIAREVSRLTKMPPKSELVAAAGHADSGRVLREVLGLVRARTGVDLSQYKTAALERRIGRRMLLRRLESPARYLEHLREHPEEIEALQRDLLIHVTSFFREQEAFEALKRSVFPELIRDRPPQSPLRLWVAGCSTGEEAYTLLMVLTEFLEEQEARYPIQLFATDLSEEALAHARAAFYSPASVAELSPERLRRFFIKRDGGYQIARRLRDACVFSRHNFAADPPFSRLDLITCRNVLIYLGAPLQQRVLATFHYALQPAGFLMLGSAETVTASSVELFSVVDKKHKLFRKKTVAAARAMSFRLSTADAAAVPQPPPRAAVSAEAIDPQREADRYLLERYAPASVIVDGHLDVVQFRGNTGRYLEPSPGAASLNLTRLLREELGTEVRALLALAKKSGDTARKERIALHDRGEERELALEIHPLGAAPGSERRPFLVVFDQHGAPPAGEQPPEAGAKKKSTRPSRRAAELEKELARTRQRLQSTIEEHETTNEQLRALNEEAQSTNEELQSTNEELETAKEELQSTNEELTTVNEELQNRNTQLSLAHDDLINLLASANLAIVMVGQDLRIRRFTPLAQQLLSLIPGDVGRPIGDLKPKLAFAEIDQLLLRVIETLEVLERDVQDVTGRWFSMRIRPYRTADNRIDGAVLTLVDVHEVRQALQEARSARAAAEAVVETVREPLLILDKDHRIRSANRAFGETFGVEARALTGTSLFELSGGGWNFPELRALLDGGAGHGKWQEKTVEREFPSVGRRRITLRVRSHAVDESGAALFVLSLQPA